MPSDNGIEPALVDDLLALETRERQGEYLLDAKLLDAEGLYRLLDASERLLNSDPSKARLLVELCADLADDAGAPAAVPRANYVLQQVHEIDGDFETKLRLVDAAHDGYAALGMNREALRTNVGRMYALIELGRHGEALDAGQIVLDSLEGSGYLHVSPTPHEYSLLVGLVHQNRGLSYEYTGRYEMALEAYAVAEGHYRDVGMKERLGEVFDNRGIVLSYLGRGSEALASHEAAAAIFDEAGLTLSHAMSLGNIGETHLWLANYMSGLGAFDRARRLLSSFDARAEEYFLQHKTADAYLALNLYSEALTSYREVDGLLENAGMEHDRAQALRGLGSALIAASEPEKAEKALTEAARLFAAVGNVPMLSGVMLEQASLLASGGDRTAAVATAHRALRLVLEKEWPIQQVYARLRLADLLLPDIDRAEPHLLAARRQTRRLALPHLRYRLNERLGHLRRLQGRDKEAQQLLEVAVDEVESLRGALVQDAMRASFLQDKMAAYEDLLQLHLDRGDDKNVRRAFIVAERAKSRALVDLLVGVVRAEEMQDAGFAPGARTENLQADLNAVYSELLGGTAGSGRPSSLPDLHARAVELEGEISRLRLQAVGAGSPSDPFAGSIPPDQVLDRIDPDTTLLAYHVVGDDILAFVGASGHTRVMRHLGSVNKVNGLLRKLNVQWGRFRAGHAFVERHMTAMERSTRRILAALYGELVLPVARLLTEGTDPDAHAYAVPKVVVVPHGVLHRVPFHALFDGERYLLERFEVSYAPSATVHVLCQEQDSQDHNGSAVFGVEDASIPSAAVEAHAVKERLRGSVAHVGDNATIGTLQATAPKSSILHLACHGLFRSDNPMFSALKLQDGWLTAAEAMSLKLPGTLVTLSACESGRGEAIGGDEVLGLTRAFLGAGASTLVVSLWLVQDETTADLMGSWYERMLAGENRTAALRAAQLELKERHAHPYYWAPFNLIGKR